VVSRLYGPGYHNLSCFCHMQGVYNFNQDYPNGLIISEIGDLIIARVN
jgi:hypothetical protein